MYAKFGKDPFFLQRYIIWCTGLLLAALILLGLTKSLSDLVTLLPWIPVAILFAHSSFRSVLLGFGASLILLGVTGQSSGFGVSIALLFAGVYVGIWSNVLIHNSAHNMIKPAWLNRLVGELAGLQVLSGFPGFAILHIEHHRHSDDVELDPHPNLVGQTFWQYIDGTRARLRSTFLRMYKERWGHRPELLSTWNRIKFLMPLNRIFRALLFLFILGPEAFTLLFITSHVTTQLAFATINFYSHYRLPDGSIEVRNLDHNLVFKILNRGFAGAFYHRNHHDNPRLFNPMNAPMRTKNV